MEDEIILFYEEGDEAVRSEDGELVGIIRDGYYYGLDRIWEDFELPSEA